MKTVDLNKYTQSKKGKTMKKLMILVLAAVIIMAANSYAGRGHRAFGSCDGMKPHPQMGHCFDGMGDRGFHRSGPGRLLALADEIGLDDAQVEKLETMMIDFQMQMVDQKSAVKKAEIRMRALKRDNDANEKKVMAVIDEMSSLRADIQKMRYQHHRQIRDVLTAEQLDKLDKLRLQRKEMRWNNRQPGYRGGPGSQYRYFQDDDNN